MSTSHPRLQHIVRLILVLMIGTVSVSGQVPTGLPPDGPNPNAEKGGKIPPVLQRKRSSIQVYARLMQLEDQRYFSPEEFNSFLITSHAGIRRRAAIAIGRIGDPRGLQTLFDLLVDDGNPTVRAAAAFAIGEVEYHDTLGTLVQIFDTKNEVPLVRARIAEAMGKVFGNPANAGKFVKGDPEAALDRLLRQVPTAKTQLAAGSDEEKLATLSITALMRTRSPEAIMPLVGALESTNTAVRWHAANALSRLLPALNTSFDAKVVFPRLIAATKDPEPLVRALVARPLGLAHTPEATQALVKLLADSNDQVVVNTVRGLGRSADPQAVAPLLALGGEQLARLTKRPAEERDRANELPVLLEIATALGNLRATEATGFLKQLRLAPNGIVGANVEVEVALAQIDPQKFYDFTPQQEPLGKEWQAVANFATGLGEIQTPEARQLLIETLEGKKFRELDPRGVPDLLRAIAKHKPDTLAELLRGQLKASDVMIRATAAELLGETPQSEESFKALSTALTAAASETMNDAKLAILTALSRYNRPETATILNATLRDNDYLVRRQAADLLKVLDPRPDRIASREAQVGIVRLDRDIKFYQQLAKLMRKVVARATLKTTKGNIELEFYLEDAPLTVYTFVNLMEKGYFDGLTFHRVVPNFVVQGGDPRGDGNGGPGFQIRCEINQQPYERGSVGMALSGKDTGGSQFFICHSPQPHLDGGYTVFGRVVHGIEVVDRITRGDQILGIEAQRPE